MACAYINNTAITPVMFGDSSLDEQCLVGMYRYPVITGSDLFECTH